MSLRKVYACNICILYTLVGLIWMEKRKPNQNQSQNRKNKKENQKQHHQKWQQQGKHRDDDDCDDGVKSNGRKQSQLSSEKRME